jgi:hypothetical protein
MQHEQDLNFERRGVLEFRRTKFEIRDKSEWRNAQNSGNALPIAPEPVWFINLLNI